MGSAMLMVVIYLELLVPDPLSGARKTPLRGLQYHLGAGECCLALKSLIRKLQVPVPTQTSAEGAERYQEVEKVVILSFTCVLSKFISFKDIYMFF